MKETLKIMGLNKSIYALSYLVMQCVIISITTFAMCLCIWIFNREQLPFINGLALFVATWLLGNAFLGMSLILQNFFSSSKLAPMVGPVILFLPTGIALFAVMGPLVSQQQNDWVQYLFILPSFPYEIIICELFQPGNNFF